MRAPAPALAIALALALAGILPAAIARAQPPATWERLSPAERAAIDEQVGGFPEERQPLLRRRLLSLAPEQRREALAQLARVRALSAGERQDLRERLRRLEGLTPEQRARLRANLERWRAMSAAERAEARERWHEFQQLPPQEQARLSHP